ncbi:MAG: hypothetical protein ACLUVG_20920 [Phocaeicola vulgatus]
MRTDKEIIETIAKLESKLANPRMAIPENASVMEGYQKAVEILKNKTGNISDAKLEALSSVQSRALCAALAIDFINGECPQYVLLDVPIK